jgi:hypothetical protein
VEREDGLFLEGVDVVMDVVGPLLEGLAGVDLGRACGEVLLPVLGASTGAVQGACGEAFFEGDEEATEDGLLSLTEGTGRKAGSEGVEELPEGVSGRWEDHGGGCTAEIGKGAEVLE